MTKKPQTPKGLYYGGQKAAVELLDLVSPGRRTLDINSALPQYLLPKRRKKTYP
jgi:hypothetical protein